MIRLRGSIGQASLDIRGFKVGIILQDLIPTYPRSEQIEDVLHTDPQSPDARTATTLIRVKSNPIHREEHSAGGRGRKEP